MAIDNAWLTQLTVRYSEFLTSFTIYMNPGSLLRNRYRIEKALAKGGFGETYLAIDLDYPGQPQMVVKHLKPAQLDPNTLQAARRLFESEAQVLAELGKNSDRIPALYAYFEEQGEFYLVQEFIEGQTLTVEFAGRKLSEPQTIEILQEILTGLVVVHRKNKIHRDLKPDNIIRRSKDGKLVLIDFGAVKEVRQVTVLSASIGIGTQGYMPTEQAIGFPRLASDIYAVGAIGIQCLTGHFPHELFDEDILALRWQHLCKISPSLGQILEKMVAQQPNERYQDAMAAREAISSLVPQPAMPTVNIAAPIKTPGSDMGGRRKLLKFLGFGGSGLIGTILLAQFLPKKSINSKISFASVKLDSSGVVRSRPNGSTTFFQEDLGNGISLAMVKIPAGKFTMGSPASEKERYNNENPQHVVTVPELYMGQTLITQSQWKALIGKNPSSIKGDDKLPVDSVSWLDAMDFCQKLSKKTGHSYRLPSEAEWEYACRAGTTSPFAFGETITPAMVNYDSNYPYANAAKSEPQKKTTTVGSFPANLFGLYDMHGNLWEWCLDEWQDNYNNMPADGSYKGNIQLQNSTKRILRGGSWNNSARVCRSANRNFLMASSRYLNIGLRVICHI